MRFFTSIGLFATSNPATSARPSEGGMKHVRMRIVVVLPAPLGPRNPTICPFSTSKEIWSTAIVRAYRLVSCSTLIIESFADGEVSTVEPRLHWRVRAKIHIKNYAFGLSIPPELLLHMIL